MRAAVLADSDTRWKWGALTARALAPGADVGARLLRGRATPTARQLADTGVTADDAREVTLTGFLDEAAGTGGGTGPYDVLVLACVGHTVQAVLQGLARTWPATTRRPVVVTGYCGVVYEKLTEGLLLRHGADLLLAGSPWDARRFRETLTGVGADARSVANWPLPFLGGTPHDPEPAARGDRPFRVVFAVQPSVPDGPAARRHLLDRAVGHARRHPDREVVLKLRSAPGEHTTHVEETPYQRLADRVRDGLPANFRLSYGHMGEVLDTTDLLVTVSSTAALESLSRGIPTAVLTDLGVREPLGNHWFTGSDCLASWDELDAGHLPVADPYWLADRGVTTPPGAPDPGAPARAALAELLTAAEGPGLPPPAPYYGDGRAPGYLPGLLARHGLDPDGAPLPGRTD
ncbi:hypothetical protein HCJ92_09890, partial [Streptomyces sp. ventii]|nr:hypothetical protein [Streptomyces spiramenti]